jgi:hypothetical protein
MLELYDTVNESEKCIVRSSADVHAGMNACSALTYDDVSCGNSLTVRTLYAKSFRLGITTVLCGTDTFFMGKN